MTQMVADDTYLFKYQVTTPHKMLSKTNMDSDAANVYPDGNSELVIVVVCTPTPASSRYPIMMSP